MAETFELIVDGVSFEVGERALGTLNAAGVIRLSSDSTYWELDETSESYGLAWALLHLDDEE